ncbi:MAG TPA: hypothetical protein VJU14_11835 [Solirubrobacterales bacterium]|nr:hypothetical protein [Solirubrobacterales bacterium]
MRRLLPPALITLLLAIAAAIGGSALAYFSSEGTGSAQAAVSKLTAPAIGAATPSAGTVALTWSAASAPGAGTVGYYVTRDGGQPAGNCPTAAAPATVTSCTDGGVAIGEHSYTVTAVWETWTAASGAKAAKVTVGPATQFTIAASTTTPAVNGSVNLTITARDVNGAVVTTHTGSHSLVFSGAAASPGGTKPTVVNSAGTAVAFGSATALNFTAGVASVSSSKNGLMRLYRSGATEVSASEGSINTPTPLLLTVSPGVATKFALAAASSSPVAGIGNDLTITAQDAYGNTATSYAGSKSLTFSGASASPGGNAPTVTDSSSADIAFASPTAIAFDAGVASAAEGDGGTMKLYKSGSTSVKATEGSVTTPIALTVTVAAAAATRIVLTSSTATPAATGTSNLTLTAQDTYVNTATSYAGAKSITFSGATASPSGSLPTVVNSAGTAISFGSATALNFANGVAAVGSGKNGLMRLPNAGATSVTAGDGTIATASPLAVTVAVGAASRLAMNGLTASAGTIGSPCLFTCTIAALGNGGTVTGAVGVTDSVGNTVSELGSGHTVKVTANGGTVTSGTALTIAATGPAVSTTQFTYTAPASGSFSNVITAAKTGGTTYTSATATATK